MLDGKEHGWFMLDNLANLGKPNSTATYYTRQIIIAKLRAEIYARSNGIGAKLLAETYAKKAAEQENALIQHYRFNCNCYYSKDSRGRFYRTEQDEVIEVTTEEELEDRIPSYINYTEEFMRVHNVKRTLTFSETG